MKGVMLLSWCVCCWHE